MLHRWGEIRGSKWIFHLDPLISPHLCGSAGLPGYLIRKITARWTTKLITVAVPCAMTNATATAAGV